MNPGGALSDYRRRMRRLAVRCDEVAAACDEVLRRTDLSAEDRSLYEHLRSYAARAGRKLDRRATPYTETQLAFLGAPAVQPQPTEKENR